MSLWIDIKYANLSSSKLDKYKVKQNNPFRANFRCPICGDSKKNPNKARGWFLQHNGFLSMKCHNCGISLSFSKFLERVDSNQFKQYTMEKFSKKKNEKKLNTNFSPKFKISSNDSLPDYINSLRSLPEDHPAVKYCKSRKLPEDKLKYVYYIDDVSRVSELDEKYKDLIKSKESRIVFPFYNKKGGLVGFTMRAIGPSQLRYMSIKISEDEPMVFGLESVDFNKKIYCVEGPIDSLFLDNAVAVSGSDMKRAINILPKDTVYVFDNQPRNREIVQLMRKVIKDGYKICVWSNMIHGKDINDMVKIGYDVQKIIDNRTFEGLRAEAEFRLWKRI